MADPLLELLLTEIDGKQPDAAETSSSSTLGNYLSRLLSLRPSDLNTTEPQSLAQSSQTNLLSLQALSSRSHRSTTTSSDQLAILRESIPTLTRTATEVKNSIPHLDDTATAFASTYSRARTSKDDTSSSNALTHRKNAMLFARQSPKLQDIIDLPALLSTAIASAASSSGPPGSANYTVALDLYAHIKRLQILYPDSRLIANIQLQADDAMKDMTSNLLAGLRGKELRLAGAIRTVGWLGRVVPELGSAGMVDTGAGAGEKGRVGHAHAYALGASSYAHAHAHAAAEEQAEGSFGALFLAARLSTFLAMTEDALAPLRDLANQETEKRMQSARDGTTSTGAGAGTTNPQPQLQRRTSAHTPVSAVQGQQTERYLKRYIEIFREQSFATIQMYRNIFPQSSVTADTEVPVGEQEQEQALRLPSALASFPLHLVTLLMETLQMYLPNVTDATARESLLVQVLYAANSLGRLGADFSMMISLLDLPSNGPDRQPIEDSDEQKEEAQVEPEWYRVIKKHRVQAARLDALASGQENATRRVSQDVAVR